MASANLSISSSSPAIIFHHGNHNRGHHYRHENISLSSVLNRNRHRKNIGSNASLPFLLPLPRRPISTIGSGHGSDGLGLLDRSKSEDEDVDEEGEILVETAPSDLAVPPSSVMRRLVRIQNSSNMLLRWFMTLPGFKERILADELFLAKVAIECGIGIVTKTTAEIERREHNFGNELDFVAADVIMALIADFMLVWLPAPTISIGTSRSPLPSGTAIFFHGCPDNAFQTESVGKSYSLSQRIGAILRNGIKLFLIGTSASLIGTGLTDALIFVKKVTDKDYAGAAGNLPILQSSIGYGVYMAVSSNLRYQFLAGVVEQRILEPVLRDDKVTLSLLCFAFRTGNTFLGSLMWVDYARFIGIQ